MNDAQMRLAVLRPCIEVECKECQVLLGYERNRGAAWEVFAQHAEAEHSQPDRRSVLVVPPLVQGYCGDCEMPTDTLPCPHCNPQSGRTL